MHIVSSTPGSGVRFARAGDGVSIAYRKTGAGYPVVKAANWMTPIELDAVSPVWKPWIDALSGEHTLFRYDPRGTGLSDRQARDACLDSYVADFAAVADTVTEPQFAVLAIGQGAAVAVEYAARHPDRVSHLVIVSGYVRGALKRDDHRSPELLIEAMVRLAEEGWGDQNPAFHQFFATHIIPNATPEQLASLVEMQRRSTAPSHAATMIREWNSYDASAALDSVRCPTLVLHCRNDSRVPIEEALFTVGGIPAAEFELLESANHIPLAQEPAFAHMMERVLSFLPRSDTTEPALLHLEQLTSRESEILRLLGQGHNNQEIGAALGVAEKTVRNRLTVIYDKIGVQRRSQAIILARGMS